MVYIVANYNHVLTDRQQLKSVCNMLVAELRNVQNSIPRSLSTVSLLSIDRNTDDAADSISDVGISDTFMSIPRQTSALTPVSSKFSSMGECCGDVESPTFVFSTFDFAPAREEAWRSIASKLNYGIDFTINSNGTWFTAEQVSSVSRLGAVLADTFGEYQTPAAKTS